MYIEVVVWCVEGLLELAASAGVTRSKGGGLNVSGFLVTTK